VSYKCAVRQHSTPHEPAALAGRCKAGWALGMSNKGSPLLRGAGLGPLPAGKVEENYLGPESPQERLYTAAAYHVCQGGDGWP